MILRKLLLVWLFIGIVLMAAAIAHGQVRYEIVGVDGTRRVMDRATYLAEVARIRAAAAGQARARTVAPGQRTTIKPQGVTYRRGPLGGQRVYAGPASTCRVGPGGRMMCGPGGCGPQQRAAPPMPWRPTRPTSSPLDLPRGAAGVISTSKSRQPSPVVVRIQSKRGPVTKHGTGTIVDWKDGTALVLTCAHILQAGFEPFVVFSDGASLPAEILASDALHDAALLTVRRSSRSRMALSSVLPYRGLIWWAGWGQNQQYDITMGRVVAIDGDFVTVAGKAREGDSGGPMYGSEARGGRLLGILTESSRLDEPGEDWKSSGPHIGWIKQFIAEHWPLASGAGVAEIPIPSAPPGANGSTPDAPGALDLAGLRGEVAALRRAIEGLKLKAGPRGLPGKDGKDGTDRPWYLRTVNQITGEEKVQAIYPGGELLLETYPHPRK